MTVFINSNHAAITEQENGGLHIAEAYPDRYTSVLNCSYTKTAEYKRNGSYRKRLG